MSDNTIRVSWADGRTEELPYQLLPAVRLAIEEDYGRPLSEVYVDQEKDGGFPKAFYESVYGWFVRRRGEVRPFGEWIDAIDDLGFTDLVAEQIRAAEEAVNTDPLSTADSSTGSAEPLIS